MSPRMPLVGRLDRLPPYLFAELDRMKRAALAEGRPVIDLGVGDPDRPTPDWIIEALREGAGDPDNHQYAQNTGKESLRTAIAAWYRDFDGVELDPHSQVLPLLGSKEGIGHAALALLDPGTAAVCPDPGYPVYRSGASFAEAEAVSMPLDADLGFLPDLERLESEQADALERARILWLCHPNNPTASVADRDFYARAIEFCRRHDLVLLQDAAYQEIHYEERPVSVLALDGADEVAVEFGSLSKTFNMTGWRVGWAAGNAGVLERLARIKANLDSGIFGAVQDAAVAALTDRDRAVAFLDEQRDVYRERRDACISALRDTGITCSVPAATFYVWFPVPEGMASADFCRMILDRADVVLTPGNGFGPAGEGWARISLTRDTPSLREAADRLRNLSL